MAIGMVVPFGMGNNHGYSTAVLYKVNELVPNIALYILVRVSLVYIN